MLALIIFEWITIAGLAFLGTKIFAEGLRRENENLSLDISGLFMVGFAVVWALGAVESGGSLIASVAGMVLGFGNPGF